MWETVDEEVRTLRIADTSSDPTQNGELTRNGNTIKAQSNGSTDDILSGGGGSGGGDAEAEALNGYVAYQVPGGTVQKFDPSDGTYSGDLNQAVQAAVDAAESATNQCVPIWIPHWDPSGNQLTVSSTATFGDNGNTFPTWAGARGQDMDYILCDIDDGSPMYQINSYRGNGFAPKGPNIYAQFNDCEFIRLEDVNSLDWYGGEFRGFGQSTASGVIVLDSTSYNGRMYDVTFNGNGPDGQTDASVSGTNIVAFEDTAGTDPPGEWGFTGFTCYADPSFPYNDAFHSTVEASNMRIINNRLEGAGGNALIYFDTGSPLIVGNQLGRTENSADRIRVTGFKAEWGLNRHSASAGGNAVYMNIGRGGFLSGAPDFSQVGDEAVRVISGAGSGQYVALPNRAMIESKYGTLSDWTGGGSSGSWSNDRTQE